MLPPLSNSTPPTHTTPTSTTRPVLYKVFLIVFYFFLGFEVAREIQNTFVLQRVSTVSSSLDLYTAFLARLTWVACLFAVVRYFWIAWKYICNTILAAPKRRPLVTLPVYPYRKTTLSSSTTSSSSLGCCSSDPSCNTKCPICLTDFQENDGVCIGPACGHAFHSECIHKWVAYSTTSCPCCRQDLWSGLPLEDTKSRRNHGSSSNNSDNNNNNNNNTIITTTTTTNNGTATSENQRFSSTIPTSNSDDMRRLRPHKQATHIANSKVQA